MQSTQADSEIEEENLLNFVVNSLNEELAIDLGDDIKVRTKNLYEVLAGASAGGTLINHVCETTDYSPHANTVQGHLTDQFNLNTVEAVRDTLLQRDALETLPDRPVEVVADLYFDHYYGDEDETEALYSSQAKRGTTTLHAYATLMRGYATSGTHWRFASPSLATPPAISSLRFSNSSTALTRGGRRLWRWSFTEFCEMVLRAA